MELPSHLSNEARQVVEQYSDCDTCKQFIIRNLSFPARYGSEREVDDAFTIWRRHTMTSSCGKFGKSRSHTGNGTYSGPWAFTLTMSPSDALTKSDLIRAVRKVMGQQSTPAIRYAWYYEDKGLEPDGQPIHPHIHGMYETATGGRIEAKHWKRAWKIWDEKSRHGSGFRGGYHRPVRSGEGYARYIAKDGKENDAHNIEDGQVSPPPCDAETPQV